MGYEILITQRLEDGKYWFDVSINDEKIIHKENTSPRTFVDVKVYASKYKSRDKSQPIADGIYKNFVFKSEDFNDTSIIGENAVSGFVDNIPVGPSPSGLNGFINNLPSFHDGKQAVSGFVDNIPVGLSPSGLKGFINNLEHGFHDGTSITGEKGVRGFVDNFSVGLSPSSLRSFINNCTSVNYLSSNSTSKCI